MRFQDIFREPEKKEKKVEYVELIYDLIFVYMIGRNNSLLQHFEGGFVDPWNFLNYILCTFAVIQMWTLTAYYINVHIFLVFALNNITSALEFMRSPEVDLMAKMLFLSLSLVLYYACLIACGAWAKPGRRPSLRVVLYSVLATALFLTAMMLLRTHMMLNIALTVLAVFLVFAALFGFSRHMDREDRSSGELPELFSR